MTVKVHIFVFPSASVTDSATVVSPGGNKLPPEDGEPSVGLYERDNGWLISEALYSMALDSPRNVFGDSGFVVTLAAQDMFGEVVSVYRNEMVP